MFCTCARVFLEAAAGGIALPPQLQGEVVAPAGGSSSLPVINRTNKSTCSNEYFV